MASSEISVKSIAEGLYPNKGLGDWFVWPPDLFALISAVFSRTGAHRRILDTDYQKKIAWQVDIGKQAEVWRKVLHRCFDPSELQAGGQGADFKTLLDFLNDPSDLRQDFGELIESIFKQVRGSEAQISGSEVIEARPLSDHLITFKKLWNSVDLNYLRAIDSPLGKSDPREFYESKRNAEMLFASMHWLLAFMDEVCCGFGLVGVAEKDNALPFWYANERLNITGSLSHLPKASGIVVPKLLTPSRGLTMRSISHHLFYQQSEVEVVWRTIPWPELREKTFNALVVTWPTEVKTEHFLPESDIPDEAGKFAYSPPDWGDTKPAPPKENVVAYAEWKQAQRDELAQVERRKKREEKAGCIVAVLDEAERENGTVQLLAMPEAALSDGEFEALQAVLRRYALSKGTVTSVPMLMCGVRHVHRGEGRTEFDEPDASDIEMNVVRISFYLADKWYDLFQPKHHRWLLDESQIKQYGLQGRLSCAKTWYEKMAVTQRRITVLAPNEWLAVTPLICEDLARQEPVTSLLRGIGPSLVLALLMDGPQIPGRWPAFYAATLADDPGSSVLTVSSLGMVELAIPKDGVARREEIILWKQANGGTMAFPQSNTTTSQSDATTSTPSKGKYDTFLLSLSAELGDQVAADGRSDGIYGTTLRLQGFKPYQCPEKPFSFETGTDETREVGRGIWSDIQELASATNTVDIGLLFAGTDPKDSNIRQMLADALIAASPSDDATKHEEVHFTYDLQPLFQEGIRQLFQPVRAEDFGIVRYPTQRGSENTSEELRLGVQKSLSILGANTNWSDLTSAAVKVLDAYQAEPKAGTKAASPDSGAPSDVPTLPRDASSRGEFLFAVILLTSLHTRVRKLMSINRKKGWSKVKGASGLNDRQEAKALLEKLDKNLKRLPTPTFARREG